MESRLVEFVQQLRALGLPIGIDQAVSFAESFTWIEPFSRPQVYHAARATLVNRQEHLDLFDRAFSEFWEAQRSGPKPQKTPRAPRHRPEQFERSTLVSFMAEKAKRDAKEVEVTDRTETGTASEWLQRKDFATLTDEELSEVRRLIATLRWDFSRRESHRLVKSHRGRRIDQRETLRRASKVGGVVIDVRHRQRKQKPRPLVLIADVSGSMELYSRIVLQFFHGLSHALEGTETFVFGTRLTRLTDALRVRHVDLALDAVSGEVADFAGGTRIAECLREFRTGWGRKVLRRGAVVLVISDGCETGSVQQLAREAQALGRSCYRLIWLNPRLGQRKYEPRVRGMAAVLPHVDDFLPIHDFESLRQLRDHLARLPKRKRGPSEISR